MNTITNAQLSSMSAWDIAKALGCHYTGDTNPIRHGGVFYSINDWQNGYANCVEFWEDPENNDIAHVSCGVINALEGKKLDSAFNCIGIDKDDTNTRNNIHAQIEACRYYFGIEPDDYTSSESFNIEECDEDTIWASVRGWIENLS